MEHYTEKSYLQRYDAYICARTVSLHIGLIRILTVHHTYLVRAFDSCWMRV